MHTPVAPVSAKSAAEASGSNSATANTAPMMAAVTRALAKGGSSTRCESSVSSMGEATAAPPARVLPWYSRTRLSRRGTAIGANEADR
eukprot:scaffold237711_cov32-Tisochrysis_lutea.AAC.2